MPNLYKVEDHGRDLLGRFMASHTMPWLRSMFFSNAHNFSLTPEFATSFCPSYFVIQEANVAPRVFATRQVTQTDGFASGSSPITIVLTLNPAAPENGIIFSLPQAIPTGQIKSFAIPQQKETIN